VNSFEAVLVALRRVIRATDLHSKQLAKHSGLTAPQILLMRSIRDQKGGATIGSLASDISLSQATVTVILDRLVNRGLVRRERSTEDRRKVHTFLTETGAALLEKAPIPLQERFTQKFSLLDISEQTIIISALQRVAKMMDAQDIDASPVLDIGILDRLNNETGGIEFTE
jgi:DNA-binding MarR family transcriptional regulator